MVLRFRKGEIVAAATLLFVVVFALTSSLNHVRPAPWRRRGAPVPGAHPYVKPKVLSWATPSPTLTTAHWDAPPTPDPSPERNRILVLASLEHEDVSWIPKTFPDWQTAVYRMPASFSQLHFDGVARAIIDKGRIANAYLTYLIENYYNLPETLVFLTPHRNAHTRSEPEPGAAEHTHVSLGKYALLKTLNTGHVQKTGYLNLRCASKSACLTTILPLRAPPDEYRTMEVVMPKAWAALFPNTTMPEKIAAPCCAEFAVSRNQVRKRGVDEYRAFWGWLNQVKMDDETAGLVMEALWHVIFGKGPVDCEEDVGVRECACDVYGRC